MKTLLLDDTNWDLVLDVGGNIAVASDPYATAQDAASACRLFQGELWYDTEPGIPYWTTTLGKRPPLSLVKTQFVRAAMRVPGVVAAQAFITSFENRRLSGQIQVTDKQGRITGAGF